MYARVATFEGGDPSTIDEDRKRIEEGMQSPPEGLEDVKEVWMLVDRESGKGLGVTVFETEEGMRRGDDALNAMSPGGGAHRTGVAFYEVALRSTRG